MININSIKINNKITKKPEAKKTKEELQVQNQEVKTVSAKFAMAVLGIKKPQAPNPSKNQNNTKDFIKNLPFAEILSPKDKREIQSDVETYYDKGSNQQMSIEDAFVPKHTNQTEGQKASKVGDVFRVDGESNIYIKTADDYSRPLKMDAETYIKLFPPIERFSGAQGSTGDCYLLSSINSVLENPYARAAIYDSFTQPKTGVTVQTYESKTKVHFADCKLPNNADKTKYIDGAVGIQMLEHLYGVNFEKQKISEYTKMMTKDISKMEKQLEKLEGRAIQGVSTEKKIKKLTDKTEKYKENYQRVKEETKNPNHKLTFVLDDNEEFVIGKYGPLLEDCDKLDSEYKNPADYYRGANGGYMENALTFLGFYSECYNCEMDEDEIDEALFAEDTNEYIITANTPSAEDEEGVETPIETDYSIFSWHVYKIQPYDDETGERMFKVTNPWNQSHQVIMDESIVKEYFSDFSICKVKM